MGATVKDIAKQANVSTATVSNVLTGKKYVSEELAARVYDVINQVGYRPNCYARGLKTNRSYTIGIQIPDITNPYFGKAVKVIQAEVAEKGYRVILYNSGNMIATEEQNIDSMLYAHVDGIIFVAPRLQVERIQEIVQIPMVVVDRLPIQTDRNVAFVYSDNYSGASVMTEYVLSKGYKHFVYLAGPVDLVTNARERLRGFLDTLQKHGVDASDYCVYYGEFTFECGQELMRQYLDEHQPQLGETITFGGSDIMAWGAMEALKAQKRKIPQDMAVVGYDNIYFSDFLYPALTTVENPIQGMSHEAAALLLGALERMENLGGKIVKIKETLIKRNSC